MTRPRKTSGRARTKRRSFALGKRLVSMWPKRRTWRRWWAKYRSAPLPAQAMVGVAAVLVLWFALNLVYQVARKPTELFFPVSGTLYKVPAETWRAYAPIFRRHSTEVM